MRVKAAPGRRVTKQNSKKCSCDEGVRKSVCVVRNNLEFEYCV